MVAWILQRRLPLLDVARKLYKNCRHRKRWVQYSLLIVVSLGAGLFRYYRMCVRAFAHYRSLLDDACWQGQIASIKAHVKKKQLENTSQRISLPKDLDVVCTGGGFKNCYSAGVIFALCESGFVFHRFAGASAGAQLAFVMMTSQFEDCLRWALTVADTLRSFPFMRPGPLWDYFYHRCADRSPLPEDGSFTVSVTELVSLCPPRGENRLVSSFEDQRAVGDGLMASGAVPLFMCRGPWMYWKGMRVLDGGLSNNTPRFRDAQRPQLVITFASLEERFKGRTCGIYWTAEEMLEVIRWGIDDAMSLVQGGAPQGLEIIDAESSLSIAPCSPITFTDILQMAKQVYLKA